MQNSGAGSGGNYLGQAIKKGISQVLDGPDNLEIATVLDDLSLQPDTFGVAIPKGEYLVCKSLTMPDTLISPGDRVLIAWVNGNDIVVIDVIISS